MRTFTGKEIDPTNPDPGVVDIIDIAHHLSMQCRYSGACTRFYSVAEHCVLMSRFFTVSEDRRHALLHDAGEAYAGDVQSDLKRHPGMLWYRLTEKAWERAVLQKFNVEERYIVKLVDTRIVANERATLGLSQSSAEPLIEVEIQCWDPWRAKHEYLETFNALFPNAVELP